MSKISVNRQCILCGKFHEVKVDESGYIDFLKGKHAQDALPELSVDDRELLISGICGSCFDKTFAESDDYDCGDDDDTDDWLDEIFND